MAAQSKELTVKTCPRCRDAKPVSAFRTGVVRGVPRVSPYCRPCEVEYRREHYNKNRQSYIDAAKKSAERHPEARKAYQRQYREQHRSQIAENAKRRANSPQRLAYSKRWRDENIERQREAEARYRDRNRASCNSRIAEWKAANPGTVQHYRRKRALASRIPGWTNLQAVAAIYAQCPPGWHVDHIVPVVSPLVCGLHCEANLAALPARENIRKGNRTWPDMP